MNNTINLQTLVDAIAKSTSSDPALIEKFLRSLTDCISDDLAAGHQVNIPGIGTFGCESLGERTNIIWQPDEALADEINAPFASFEPVVLAEGVTDDDLNATNDTDATNDEIPELPPAIPTPATVPTPPAIPTPIVTTEPESTEVEAEPEPEATEPEVEITTEPEPEPQQDDATYDYDDDDDNKSNGAGWWIFAIVIAAILGYLCATFCPNPIRNYMTVADDDIEETDTITTDDDQADTDDTYTYVSDDSVAVDNSAIAPLPTTSAKVVTDTVRPGRFLATMARRHYGNYKFWVYIYLENRDKIPNPDNLPAGTVLVIPPAEKYGIDASDPASVSRAEAAIRHIEKR